jgi:hypothetical protein
MTFKYRPLLRPASFCTLPQGVQWDYVEAPSYVTARTDLPRSRYTHGIISTNRQLTASEQKHFDLMPV